MADRLKFDGPGAVAELGALGGAVAITEFEGVGEAAQAIGLGAGLTTVAELWAAKDVNDAITQKAAGVVGVLSSTAIQAGIEFSQAAQTNHWLSYVGALARTALTFVSAVSVHGASTTARAVATQVH